eukprot:11634984-Heterocapsa_arctica.AAC.1
MSLIVFPTKHEKNTERANILRQHAAGITSPNDLKRQVHICRILKAFESSTHRLMLAVSDSLRT